MGCLILAAPVETVPNVLVTGTQLILSVLSIVVLTHQTMVFAIYKGYS